MMWEVYVVSMCGMVICCVSVVSVLCVCLCGVRVIYVYGRGVCVSVLGGVCVCMICVWCVLYA